MDDWVLPIFFFILIIFITQIKKLKNQNVSLLSVTVCKQRLWLES
jgi:hypothetical protein